MDIRNCITKVVYDIQGILASKYEKDCCEFYKEKHKALELHVSMKKPRYARLCPQTHFGNVQDLTKSRGLPRA